ncbi:VOC family protein [Williamsia maris]|uniref:Catechol 2,3-dioxygenase n=1 Tax=Williamsia maris TaxID=72806 RepID=A0ABT1H8Z9_9NOCA|nr:VOC family protein [Williamsia maris]MCP2174732.1 Catechol 2,3-dioxygenase [Williamsia maris]
MTVPTPSFTVTAVDHTGLTVSDIDRSIRFWTEVMGFELRRRGHLAGEFATQVTGVDDADIATAIIAAPGHTIELLQYSSPGMTPDELRSPAAPGTKHLAFTVDDIVAVRERLADHGWFTRGSVQTMTEGPRAGTKFLYLHDSDGLTLEFIEPAKEPAPQ